MRFDYRAFSPYVPDVDRWARELVTAWSGDLEFVEEMLNRIFFEEIVKHDPPTEEELFGVFHLVASLVNLCDVSFSVSQHLVDDLAVPMEETVAQQVFRRLDEEGFGGRQA